MKCYKGFEGSSAELRVRLVILDPVSKFHGMTHQHEASPFRRNMFGTSTFSKSEMTYCPLGWFIPPDPASKWDVNGTTINYIKITRQYSKWNVFLLSRT